MSFVFLSFFFPTLRPSAHVHWYFFSSLFSKKSRPKKKLCAYDCTYKHVKSPVSKVTWPRPPFMDVFMQPLHSISRLYWCLTKEITTHTDVRSQKLSFPVYTSTLKTEFLKIFILAKVLKKYLFYILQSHARFFKAWKQSHEEEQKSSYLSEHLNYNMLKGYYGNSAQWCQKYSAYCRFNTQCC